MNTNTMNSNTTQSNDVNSNGVNSNDVNSNDVNSNGVNTGPSTHYKAPGRMTRWIMNPIVSALVKVGVPLKGAGVLSVPGRTTGEWRSVPVNPLSLDGEQFLVAARGETQWVRNMRAAGGGRIRRGRRTDDFTAVELDDTAKPGVLRAYLKQWAWEVGAFFEGVGADSSDEQLAAIAARHPIFRITAV
jgi:deazaflavin-dependent oxidoreductase (nitroreductase family)